MDRIANPLEAIGELLTGRARPVIAMERLAPSAIYDVRYRVAVIAAAFELHAKPMAQGERRILAPRLKLLQFIACRPWLLDMVRRWSEAQGDAQLLLATSQRLRHGYLGDETHEEVLSFLIARGMLAWSAPHVTTGPRIELLRGVYVASVEQELFCAEREVLKDLLGIRITNAMLEGW